MITVHDLRKNGYKVKVFHNRVYRFKRKCDGLVPIKLPRGGRTCVVVIPPEWKLENKGAYGIAQCSDEDNYNKKLGVKIALGRAFKNLENNNITEFDDTFSEVCYGIR